jgi:hypothetical protein
VGQTLLESKKDNSISVIGQERTGKWALEFYHAQLAASAKPQPRGAGLLPAPLWSLAELAGKAD